MGLSLDQMVKFLFCPLSPSGGVLQCKIQRHRNWGFLQSYKYTMTVDSGDMFLMHAIVSYILEIE